MGSRPTERREGAVMRFIHRVGLVTALLFPLAVFPVTGVAAANTGNDAFDFRTRWPTHTVLGDGTDIGVTAKYQFDLDRFSGDRGTLEDAQTNRRKEFGIFARKKGVYDATAVFDFQMKTWLDVFVRMQSKPWLGVDAGSLRIGFSKTLVGFESLTGTGSTTFLEVALPVQAIYAGRRVGADWMIVRPHWFLDVGYYWAGDLQGDADGRMTAARFAWTPRNTPGDVLHLGMSGSRETPDGTRDGRGVRTPPSARLRARPEAGLLDQRLVDSGALRDVGYVDRRGLEFLLIDGPWAAKSEYLDAKVTRAGRRAYEAHGWYAFTTWILTGESRSYANANLSDVDPVGTWGAVELALRYSTLDLDDGTILGGTEHDWTVGANWYLTRYLKLQGNYVHATSDRRDLRIDPDIVEVRAQIMF